MVRHYLGTVHLVHPRMSSRDKRLLSTERERVWRSGMGVLSSRVEQAMGSYTSLAMLRQAMAVIKLKASIYQRNFVRTGGDGKELVIQLSNVKQNCT